MHCQMFFDLINARLGGEAIYLLHEEGSQEMQNLEAEIQDATSRLRQCLYVVMQNPVCSEDVTYAGKTHFTVLTRDWSQQVSHGNCMQQYNHTQSRQ